MIGVWPKSTGLLGATGRDQATSVIALYGPRTTVLVALDDGVYEFTYGAVPEGSDIDPKETPWICTRHQIQIHEDSKIFSPANLRSAQDLPGYQDLVNYYMTNRYTLRCECWKEDDINHRHSKRNSVFSHACRSYSPLYKILEGLCQIVTCNSPKTWASFAIPPPRIARPSYELRLKRLRLVC